MSRASRTSTSAGRQRWTQTRSSTSDRRPGFVQGRWSGDARPPQDTPRWTAGLIILAAAEMVACTALVVALAYVVRMVSG